ncbi:MAG: GNAT family N-acetyltransferase [Candidatus Eisenbacteria bacterium]|nr:GNAT family N-acetyltransferase [Candidatus Eisenbacteria bacterium]MCC7144293.1 GNAT family N-acetyltransferase [Candidatus Eisenbacteria bacterium]
MQSDLVFSTDRLTVRRWRESDYEALLAVYGDADAMRWVGDGQPITPEECRQWLVVTGRNYEMRGYGMYAVERLVAPGVIGFCGIVHPGGQEEPEVKYAYLRSHWGQGFATEALVGLLHHGAEDLRLQRMMATAAPENTASHRVLQKAGMRIGELRTDADGSRTQVFYWVAPGNAH